MMEFFSYNPKAPDTVIGAMQYLDWLSLYVGLGEQKIPLGSYQVIVIDMPELHSGRLQQLCKLPP